MNPFKQRSSLSSSLITGLVGWLGFIFVGPLIFGFKTSTIAVTVLAIISSVIQILLLRSFFFVLHMQKNILVGAFWGLVSALLLYYISQFIYIPLQMNSFYWILIYIYIGAPVGGFLSYFYIDDKKIMAEHPEQTSAINYGRDAHWLEPFVFGALAYSIVFLSFKDLDIAVNVFVLGAISGVVAAGSSHFSPDKWKKSYFLIAVLSLGLGILHGLVSGWLLRHFAINLYANNYVLGMIAASITFLTTFLRGRYLANKEEQNAF